MYPALLMVQAKLFHTAVGTAYADLQVDDHRETWPIRSRPFRAWLRRSYYEAAGTAASALAIKIALDQLEARAQFDSPERSVHLRVAECGNRIYLDLADSKWRAVEIAAPGWRVIDNPPVRFRRPPGLLPLPLGNGSGKSPGSRRKRTGGLS